MSELTNCEKYGHYCPNCDNSFQSNERLERENAELREQVKKLEPFGFLDIFCTPHLQWYGLMPEDERPEYGCPQCAYNARKEAEQERDDARAEASACIKFLESELGWEGFRAEGFVGQDAVSASTKNCQRLAEFLRNRGNHGARLFGELEDALAEVARLREALTILSKRQCGSDCLNRFKAVEEMCAVHIALAALAPAAEKPASQ